MKEVFLGGDDSMEYLNENIGKIKRFEIIDEWYFRVHMSDGSYIEVTPEYGGIYFQLKSEAQD